VHWHDDGLREGDLAIRAAMTGWFTGMLTAAGHSWVLLTGNLQGQPPGRRMDNQLAGGDKKPDKPRPDTGKHRQARQRGLELRPQADGIRKPYGAVPARGLSGTALSAARNCCPTSSARLSRSPWPPARRIMAWMV
jgi:hypothetical protein